MGIMMGIFLILHGLMHLLYAGQSWRLFELRPGMLWPNNAWLFSPLLGDGPTRYLATISLALAALSFWASGLGLFFGQAWWHPAAVGAVLFSAVIFLIFNTFANSVEELKKEVRYIVKGLKMSIMGFLWCVLVLADFFK